MTNSRDRLLALARKALDESSPEPERNTSAQMLAREIVKLLEKGGDLFSKPTAYDRESQRNADRADNAVRQAVATAKGNPAPPESPPTWVEFDPASSPSTASPFSDNRFGSKPRRRG